MDTAMQDTWFFFERHQTVYPLYERFQEKLLAHFPESRIKIQRSQISYYDRHLYACVSFLKVKKKADLRWHPTGWRQKLNRIPDGGRRILSSAIRLIWTENYSAGSNRRIVLPNQSDADKYQFVIKRNHTPLPEAAGT